MTLTPCSVVLLSEHSYALASAPAELCMRDGVVTITNLSPMTWEGGSAAQVQVRFVDHKGGTVRITVPIQQVQLAVHLNDADMGYEEKR